MEVLKDDGGPCQISLVASETAAVIASKSSTTPLPSAPSLTNIPPPPHGTSQFDPIGKQHLAPYPHESLSGGMPEKLRSLPTQQTTKQQTSSPTSNNSNHNNRDMILRSGKWNPEEELYANILIELFEEGRVDEFEKNLDGNNNDQSTSNEEEFKVTNGMTLRAYLSRKLYCSPMRISKKFAGRGIGKLVYMSQRSGSYQGFRQRFPYGAGRMYHNNRAFSHPSDIHWTKLNRLKEAESNFLRLAFPNGRPQQKLVRFVLLTFAFVH